MSHVFHRARDLPVAVAAKGVWITDAQGRRYLDACGGAIVNGVGHGRAEIADRISNQVRTLDYVHAHSFTSGILEAYADRLAPLVPVSDARLFPVSGGSEAVETAIKLARTYHVARGERGREMVIGRFGSYHGNTLGALDVSDRPALRSGYEPWLGRFEHMAIVNEYRCPNPDHPARCAEWHADGLDTVLRSLGRGAVAAFVAEPIGGATLGVAMPPDGYWKAIVDVCRRHGVLVIVDEVMTGFGRTGRWFGLDHFGIDVDMVVIAKGATSGYWPFGACIASAEVADTAAEAFTHGYTYSHHPVGAAAATAVLDILQRESLVERSRTIGDELAGKLADAVGSHPFVGDIRGRGSLLAVEIVENRESKFPFDPAMRIAERVRLAMIERGVIPYPVAGCADGRSGDAVMFGPPFIIESGEIDLIVETVDAALRDALP